MVSWGSMPQTFPVLTAASICAPVSSVNFVTPPNLAHSRDIPMVAVRLSARFSDSFFILLFIGSASLPICCMAARKGSICRWNCLLISIPPTNHWMILVTAPSATPIPKPMPTFPNVLMPAMRRIPALVNPLTPA